MTVEEPVSSSLEESSFPDSARLPPESKFLKMLSRDMNPKVLGREETKIECDEEREQDEEPLWTRAKIFGRIKYHVNEVYTFKKLLNY